jgi:hypothetical protein
VCLCKTVIIHVYKHVCVAMHAYLTRQSRNLLLPFVCANVCQASSVLLLLHRK